MTVGHSLGRAYDHINLKVFGLARTISTSKEIAVVKA
jgi:hypothetical protein